MKRYTRKELKLMLKYNQVPHDAPSFIHQEIERRRLEIERNMRSDEEEMEIFMKEFQARKWMPVKKKPAWMNWFYRTLKVQRTPKIINRIKELFR